MYKKEQEDIFKQKKEQLISSYSFIPTKNTINTFIKYCFHNQLSNTFSNLNEEDRKTAYFYGFSGTREQWGKKEEEYFSLFPKNESLSALDLNYFTLNGKTGVDNFENLTINDLSVKILNSAFFEYKVSEQIREFKKSFNFLIDEYISTKNHQLYAIKEDISERKLMLNQNKDIELNIENIDYNKFHDIIQDIQNELKTFIDNKFAFIEANFKGTSIIDNDGIKASLLKVIDGENKLQLYYKYQNYLICNGYLDKKTLKWVDSGGKSSFMRFFLKCENHELIKPGKKRPNLIRILSDIFKIDSVVKYDYSIKRCNHALDKNPDEFTELDVIKSQHSLNLENN